MRRYLFPTCGADIVIAPVHGDPDDEPQDALGKFNDAPPDGPSTPIMPDYPVDPTFPLDPGEDVEVGQVVIYRYPTAFPGNREYLITDASGGKATLTKEQVEMLAYAAGVLPGDPDDEKPVAERVADARSHLEMAVHSLERTKRRAIRTADELDALLGEGAGEGRQ